MEVDLILADEELRVAEARAEALVPDELKAKVRAARILVERGVPGRRLPAVTAQAYAEAERLVIVSPLREESARRYLRDVLAEIRGEYPDENLDVVAARLSRILGLAQDLTVAQAMAFVPSHASLASMLATPRIDFGHTRAHVPQATARTRERRSAPSRMSTRSDDSGGSDPPGRQPASLARADVGDLLELSRIPWWRTGPYVLGMWCPACSCGPVGFAPGVAACPSDCQPAVITAALGEGAS